MTHADDLETAREQHRPDFFEHDAVTTLACDHDEGCLRVGVDPDHPRPKLPDEVDGIPVHTHQEKVELEPMTLTGSEDVKDRYQPFRPVPIGVLIAEAAEPSAGSTGLFWTDGDTIYVGTAGHLVDDPETDDSPEITQSAGAKFGKRVVHQESNSIDFGTVEPTHGRILNHLYGLDAPPEGPTYTPSEGDEVQLCVMNSGLQTGTIAYESIDVNAGSGVITDAIATEDHITQGGDSGGAWVYEETDDEGNVRYRPVGMHFAGGTRSYACKIANVEEETGLSVVTGETLQEPTETLGEMGSAIDPVSGRPAIRNTLEVSGNCTYSVEATGDLAPKPYGTDRTGAATEPIHTAEQDTWYYAGNIQAFRWDGDRPTVRVNGDETPLAELPARQVDLGHSTLPEPIDAASVGVLLGLVLLAILTDDPTDNP